jgi:hypothetical protein
MLAFWVLDENNWDLTEESKNIEIANKETKKIINTNILAAIYNTLVSILIYFKVK